MYSLVIMLILIVFLVVFTCIAACQSSPEEELPELESMTKKQIKDYADEMGLDVDINLKKAEMIEDLEDQLL